MFIILGLLILVVSFVVALATLLREQKNQESSKETEDTSNIQKAVNIQPTGVTEKVTQIETSFPKNSAEVHIDDALIDEEQETAHEQVTAPGAIQWKSTHNYDMNSTGEQQKIAEIREELAKIAGEKVSKPRNASIGVVTDTIQSSEVDSRAAGEVNRLSGEISLRGNKDGD